MCTVTLCSGTMYMQGPCVCVVTLHVQGLCVCRHHVYVGTKSLRDSVCMDTGCV